MHLIENHQSIVHTDNVMEILHTTNRGRSMDTIEKYHIYKETKNCNQITDKDCSKTERNL